MGKRSAGLQSPISRISAARRSRNGVQSTVSPTLARPACARISVAKAHHSSSSFAMGVRPEAAFMASDISFTFAFHATFTGSS